MGIAIVIIGVVLIIWWFFIKPKPVVVEATQVGGLQTAKIVVDGGYSPRVIRLKQGVPAKLSFLRKDPSACLEEIIVPEFGIHQKLELNKSYEVTVNPDKPGRYKYSCGMEMIFGTIEVT